MVGQGRTLCLAGCVIASTFVRSLCSWAARRLHEMQEEGEGEVRVFLCLCSCMVWAVYDEGNEVSCVMVYWR